MDILPITAELDIRIAEISPVVPEKYITRNTFYSDVTLTETRLKINAIITKIGVFKWSPDALLCVAKACINHEYVTFQALLFHSELGEFVELRRSRGDDTAYTTIETAFMESGFIAGVTNFARVGFLLPSEFAQFELTETVPVDPIDKLKEKFERAMFCTEHNASYREILVGVRLFAHLLRQDAVFEQGFNTNSDAGYMLLTRLFKFVLEAPECELRCLALDALTGLNRYKSIIQALAVQLLEDKDPLVCFIAARMLV